MAKGLDGNILNLLKTGTVIPACPLAINKDRVFDDFTQRVLVHYYMEANAGGLAVGVHTTQFNIRDQKHNLYARLLSVVHDEIVSSNIQRPFIKIAGVCGETEQAIQEAITAEKIGYDMVLLSMGGLDSYTEYELLERTKRIADIMPVFGFYLQPNAGGRRFSYEFWQKFADIEGVIAIKTAPFNRYDTLDVLRAVCSSKRCNEITVYTGNDDNIVADLLTKYKFNVNGQIIEKEICGGLLGHWAVWTSKAAELLDKIKKAKDTGAGFGELLAMGTQITDCNAAFFDVNNNFFGCIPGINEVLARQGLLQGNWCLDEKEILGEGQMEEINRVYKSYPELNDDKFIADNIEKWKERVREKQEEIG